jgi:transcriptional regulator with XRE-family HTH domain
MQAEIAQLQRIRLKENLSYRELGDRCDLSEPTMRRVLQAADPVMYDRTLYKIRAFLERRKSQARRRRRATSSAAVLSRHTPRRAAAPELTVVPADK